MSLADKPFRRSSITKVRLYEIKGKNVVWTPHSITDVDFVSLFNESPCAERQHIFFQFEGDTFDRKCLVEGVGDINGETVYQCRFKFNHRILAFKVAEHQLKSGLCSFTGATVEKYLMRGRVMSDGPAATLYRDGWAKITQGRKYIGKTRYELRLKPDGDATAEVGPRSYMVDWTVVEKLLDGVYVDSAYGAFESGWYGVMPAYACPKHLWFTNDNSCVSCRYEKLKHGGWDFKRGYGEEPAVIAHFAKGFVKGQLYIPVRRLQKSKTMSWEYERLTDGKE